MRVSSSRDSVRGAAGRPSWAACASAQLLFLILLGMTCITGCSGCGGGTGAQTNNSQGDEEDDVDKPGEVDEEKKKKPPYEVKPVVPLLSESIVTTETDEPLSLAKPGHWTSTVQPMRANYNDLDATSTLEVLQGTKPAPLKDTPFYFVSSRPAVLAKGQVKRVFNEILIPEDATPKSNVTSRLTERGSRRTYQPGIEGYESGPVWKLMPPYQYFILVLAADPDAYGFLSVTDTVRAPWEDIDGNPSAIHYRVALANGTKAMPVPTSALNLTSVAYILWDEVNIDRLNPEQQTALVDWIHWGGRLIVNGPDSLAALRGSFLDPYLPVDFGDAMQIDAEKLINLNNFWTQRTAEDKPLEPLTPRQPWSGVELKPRDPERDAEVPHTDGLLVERTVGCGSVVVSAFQLTERDFVNWEGFDGFLNSALLRRAGRRIFKGDYDGVCLTWAYDAKDSFKNRLNAYFTTPLRWFSRDAATTARMLPPPPEEIPGNLSRYTSAFGTQNQPDYDPADYSPRVDRRGGLGSWNDFNPVAEGARNALKVAAGVRVPAASFVVICLAVYLFVLVPLNWMVFHALGRIEWAWIAAPLIAVVGTIVVVQQAQLDIGFVRAQTEIALLELQQGYDRGHLTRFTALYSSLSTTYELEFDEPSAVATPFPTRPGFEVDFGDRIDTVAFEKYDKTRLRGLPVTSASTRFVHSEQMFPLDGGVSITKSSGGLPQLDNRTGLILSDAMLLRRDFDFQGRARYSAAWIGQLGARGVVLMPVLKPIQLNADELPFSGERELAAAADSGERLDVDELLQLATSFPDPSDPFFGQRAETRLIARIDGMLPGAVASPAASQTSGTTVVVAHVEYPGPLPTPQLDETSVAGQFPKGRPAGLGGGMEDSFLQQLEEAGQ